MNISEIDINNPPKGFTVLYFTGKAKTKTYTSGRAAYRAGNTARGRVILVKDEHVNGLMRYGVFSKTDPTPAKEVEVTKEEKPKSTSRKTTKSNEKETA